MAERFERSQLPGNNDLNQPLRQRLEFGSALHSDLLGRITQRRELSQRHISQRYDQWNEADDHIQFYINLNKKAKRADNTRDPETREMPFDRAIVIPASYATLMVRLTTLMHIFLARDPFIQIKGVGPEDIKSAKIVEGILAYDFRRMQSPLVLYSGIQDAEKYGLGIIKDGWDVESGLVERPVRMLPGLLGMRQRGLMRSMGIPEVRTEWATIAEGNMWRTIDPYSFWPDPRIPGHRLQEGEFCGDRSRHSYMWLYERSDEIEGNNGVYFNIKHLKKGNESGGRQVVRRADNASQRDLAALDFRDTVDERDRGIFDVDSMQIKLIPKEWGLSPETRPEIWWFAMANDAVIIRAHKSPHQHNRFTYSTMSPNYDAHTVFQQGNVENMAGLQRLIDWLFNSHIENVRRHLNNAMIYSPTYIEEEDVLNPKPAGHFRLTSIADDLIRQGTHTASSFISQVPVADVTGQHLRDVETIFELIHRMLGTNDPVSGQTTESKRTLGEVERIIAASGKRLTLTAQLYDTMAIQELAKRSIQNRQQFTELEQYIEITGELAREEGIERLMVNREKLRGSYDYVPISGTVPPDPARFADIWFQFMEIAAGVPQLQQPGPDGQVVDLRKIMKEGVQALGIRDFDEFLMQVAPAAGEVAPDEFVQQQAQAGNVIPPDQAEIGANGTIAGAGIQGDIFPGAELNGNGVVNG